MERLIVRLVVMGIAMSSVTAMESRAEENHDLDWYAHAVQDVITYYGDDTTNQVMDLFSDQETPVIEDTHVRMLDFNGEKTSIVELAEQLKESDSVCLYGADFGKQNGLAMELADILMLIGETGIDDQFINLSMEYLPRQKSEDFDLIRIASDGTLTLSGNPVELSDLAGLLSADRKVGIESVSSKPPPFSAFLEVVQSIGSKNVHHIFVPNRDQQVQISAKVFQINEDGSEKVLSSPMFTAQPGFEAKIGVVSSNNGSDQFRGSHDPFHQEDLGNLGVRFSGLPELIGDHLRVSGVIELVRSTDPRQEVFKQGDIPIYSYSVSKHVVPFSAVLAPGQEYVEFPAASINGKKTIFRLSADIVDGMGMTRKERDEMRQTATEPE